MFVDSHCHLEGPRFSDDRTDTIVRAKTAGLVAMLAIGNGDGPSTADCAIKLAETQERGEFGDAPKIYASVGVHPHEAKLADDAALSQLASWARNPHVIAWGEIGLDYHYDHSPRDVQQQVFIKQMELARNAKLPIIIHNRPSENTENAWDDLFHFLNDHWKSSGLGGVLHCFTGEEHHARAALDMGFMISFAGNVTYPKATNIHQVAKSVPLDRMFIETDCPYLAPVPMRGKRNEPSYVVETAGFIAQMRGLSAEKLGRLTAENFFRFFQLKSDTHMDKREYPATEKGRIVH
ncbi:MAG TPA: TatD family hydrolase [Terriglobales bacterium]|nr:TatD family hydrolase [Terriglobales bacterium]